jgi:hypothetical protein
MKTYKILPFLALLALPIITSCSKDELTSTGSENSEYDSLTVAKTALIIDSLPYVLPDSASISYLQFLRGEEYLAHDVYELFFNTYGSRIFGNILKSELRHTTAIQNLLIKYNIPDPEAQHIAGVFANPDLQALYNTLVIMGSENLTKALEVGKAIEIKDIEDLDNFLNITQQEDLVFVLSNLKSGSERHLRAFNAWLE